jgi:hypothetical protein
MKVVRRSVFTLLALSGAYLLLLAYPQPLFAYELRHAGITIHSTAPIPDAMRSTLERVRTRLDRSPIAVSAADAHVFLCHSRWVFALFARQNYRVGGVANSFIGQHVFLRESDMAADRLISPGGQPVAADRPLSYFIAHELMHIANTRAIGRWRYSQLPQWVDDGYADYIARDVDLGSALVMLKAGTRELDPTRSGLYLRYHLMVAFLLEKKRMTLDDLLQNPPDREVVERDLATLVSW